MAEIKSFKAYRPQADLVEKVASKPYDVLNSKEAREIAKGNPHSFLHIIKPEIDLDPNIDPYDQKVYETAKANLQKFIKQGTLVQDEANCLYLYRIQMGAHIQTGLVALSSTQDYWDDVIKKHEYTRPKKEKDRIKHMQYLGAHVGPVFMTYPQVLDIDVMTDIITYDRKPDVHFTADDKVIHSIWLVKDEKHINELVQLFADKVPATYIADGHHRAASASKVGRKIAETNKDHTGKESYNHFLTVLFPDNQMKILDYNRVVTDLNGLNKDQLLEKLNTAFEVTKIGGKAYRPEAPNYFGLYIDHTWYKLVARPKFRNEGDVTRSLDISILQENILEPLLGIKDQRTDERIDFVGGIRGLEELEKRVNSGEMKLAISLYPVSVKQLIDIADAGMVMPPKSTWFEPKLRSGLIVHKFE